jgi:hypothetical protein
VFVVVYFIYIAEQRVLLLVSWLIHTLNDTVGEGGMAHVMKVGALSLLDDVKLDC